MDEKEKLLTVKQAAGVLGVNTGTLRRWAQKNIVNGLKVGTRGDWRFKKDELQKIIRNNDAGANSPKFPKRIYAYPAISPQ
jgi:excisionase family DNA binding protein